MSSRGQPTVLADRYELGEVLGRGGMAEVRLARDRRLGRTVAVKMMRAELVDRADFVARFGKEARSVAALNHPTVVAVYDSGEARLPRVDGTDVVPYIVMEYVAGRTLGQVIDEGPLPLDQALSVTADVLTALEHAHAAGIVHRDIKPSNVMLTPDGAAKVMDFGIARVLSDATMTTTVVATPHYVSPEHAHGQRVDARSDLYSVGCMLFELLTGRPPFVAETSLAVVLQHINEPPPLPSAVRPGVSPVLDQVVGKALAKERDDRYQTAVQFRDDLEAVARGEEPPVAGQGPVAGPPPAPTVVALTAPGPGPERSAGAVSAAPLAAAGSSSQPTGTGSSSQPTGAGFSSQPTVPSPTLSPTVAYPALESTRPQLLHGPVGPEAVPDGRVAPGWAGAPVAVGQPRRTARWWLVGAAVVLVAVVACVVWLQPWGGGGVPPQASPTGAVQEDDIRGLPAQGDPADHPGSDSPFDQPTKDVDVDPVHRSRVISVTEFKELLKPPNASSPSIQDATIGNEVQFVGTYQSKDSIDSLARHYQNKLADLDEYYSGSVSNGMWQATASAGDLHAVVQLTERGSETSVQVVLSGTE